MKSSALQTIAIVFTTCFFLVETFCSFQSQAAPLSNDVVSGERLFTKSSCSGCHPGGGNLLHPNMPLKGPGFQAKYKDDQSIAKVIRTGVANSGMPSFSQSRLSDQELKLIIAYIRSLTPMARDNKH